jgi:hypothetical protein
MPKRGRCSIAPTSVKYAAQLQSLDEAGIDVIHKHVLSMVGGEDELINDEGFKDKGGGAT